MGYKFQFVTLAGFHALNHGMFELATGYRDRGMAAYSELQQAEFASEADGYTATRHQREVGTGYFDQVAMAISGGAVVHHRHGPVHRGRPVHQPHRGRKSGASTMTTERFWVVGGDFACTGFEALRDGAGHVSGPFGTREEATVAWRSLSEQSRSKATARYAITAEQIRLPN